MQLIRNTKIVNYLEPIIKGQPSKPLKMPLKYMLQNISNLVFLIMLDDSFKRVFHTTISQLFGIH